MHILKYIISFLFFLGTVSLFSQEKEIDTAKYKDRYGLRVGIDLFNPVYALFDDNRKGLEIVADYRILKRFWIAGELGYMDNTTREDHFTFTTNGSYIKVGADFNAYKNALGMENMIVVGMRYGVSIFDQTVNEYTINSDPYLPIHTNDIPIVYNNLNAHWIEFSLGLKVEVLHNVYMGVAFSGKHIITTKNPDNFKNLFIPGFNRVYVNDFGFGINYTISYLIPFYRK